MSATAASAMPMPAPLRNRSSQAHPTPLPLIFGHRCVCHYLVPQYNATAKVKADAASTHTPLYTHTYCNPPCVLGLGLVLCSRRSVVHAHMRLRHAQRSLHMHGWLASHVCIGCQWIIDVVLTRRALGGAAPPPSNPLFPSGPPSSLPGPLPPRPPFPLQDGSNIFTESRIAYMQKVEQHIVAMPNYTQFCVIPAGRTECLPPTSLIAYFYANDLPGCPGRLLPDGARTVLTQPISTTLMNLIDPFLNETYCAACVGGVGKFCQEPDPSAIDFAVDNGFGYNLTAGPPTDTDVPNLDSEVTKTIFQFGMPLKGFNSSEDRRDDQIALIEEFVKTFLPYLDKQTEDNEVGITVLINAPVQLEMHFNDIIFSDSILVVISITIVWLYVWFHTQSLWISSFGILHVILSFPCAYFISKPWGAAPAMTFRGLAPAPAPWHLPICHPPSFIAFPSLAYPARLHLQSVVARRASAGIHVPLTPSLPLPLLPIVRAMQCRLA